MQSGTHTRTKWYQTDGLISRWLGRPELEIEVPHLQGNLLITGAQGFIGQQILAEAGAFPGLRVFDYDIQDGDVLNRDALKCCFNEAKPDYVLHLAAHKYATSAEELPESVADLNIRGTQNVVDLAEQYDARLVLASTCKAVDPITVYGASKLIAERIARNYYRGRVFRLVNVISSSGSVIDIWDKIPLDDALPVTDCLRYWISPREAARYLLRTISLTPGIYTPYMFRMESPTTIANRYAPNREQYVIPSRRGDRRKEIQVGNGEGCNIVPSEMLKIKEHWR